MSWTDLVASREDKLGALTFDLSIGQKLDRINQFNRDGGNEYDFTIDHSFTLKPRRCGRSTWTSGFVTWRSMTLDASRMTASKSSSDSTFLSGRIEQGRR
jgi:hypothetical protein